MSVRPTLRCLTNDLGLKIPPADIALDEIDHPLLRKASDQFTDPSGLRERILSIDDTVMFKVKVQRWRGAAWNDADDQTWLVAAGQREAGSRDDFYQALATAARTAKTRYNNEHTSALRTDTYTAAWLPNADDHDRYILEAGLRFRRELKATVLTLARNSLLDGREHTAEVGGAILGIQVRAEDGHETYVALRIVGAVREEFLATVLILIPGCDRDDWGYELAMPDRELADNEQVWSNMMAPSAAAELLNADRTL
jgi:hypothetical protein